MPWPSGVQGESPRPQVPFGDFAQHPAVGGVPHLDLSHQAVRRAPEPRGGDAPAIGADRDVPQPDGVAAQDNLLPARV